MLNNHFANVSDNIVKNLPSGVSIMDYLLRHLPPTFDFTSITAADIADAINRLGSTQAAGMDGLTALLVKSAKSELTSILEYLFNRSLTLKIYPRLWKEAVITNLYKSGSRSDPSNYHPISVLSTVRKIFERWVHDQLYSYLDKYNLLCKQQSGFRKGTL